MAEETPSVFASGRLRVQPSPLAAEGSGPSILFGYTRKGVLGRHPALGWLLVLAFMALYGGAFALFMPALMLPMLLPFAVLALLVIWLLPEMQRPPIKTLAVLLFAYLIALLCWPDYLALTLPGLPWITAIRLTGTPLVLLLLLCLSVSSGLRGEIMAQLRMMPVASWLLAMFMVVATLSIAFPGDVLFSVNRYILIVLNWICVFLVSCVIFNRPGMTRRFVWLLWGCTLLVCGICLLEWRAKAVPWAGHIPSFLQIEDPNVIRFLSGTTRAAGGIYRAQSKFTTSLGFGEFLALSTPFILHMTVISRSLFIRFAGAGTLALVLWCVIRTGSRLAILGFMLSFLLYIAIYAVLSLRRNPDNLVARMVLLSYPLMFGAFVLSTFTVDAVKYRVWGGGAAQYSTQARQEQWRMGVPMVVKNPLGHGIGRGALTLGFVTEKGTLTIDSYYLSVLLETGLLGFIGFYGTFVAAIFYAGRRLWFMSQAPPTDDYLYVGPACIALVNFLVGKSVLSQQENHPLVFVILALLFVLGNALLRCQPQSPLFLPAGGQAGRGAR